MHRCMYACARIIVYVCSLNHEDRVHVNACLHAWTSNVPHRMTLTPRYRVYGHSPRYFRSPAIPTFPMWLYHHIPQMHVKITEAIISAYTVSKYLPISCWYILANVLAVRPRLLLWPIYQQHPPVDLCEGSHGVCIGWYLGYLKG